jgi:hypothetical protein
MAPAGVPQEVVNRVNAEVNALLKTPEVRVKGSPTRRRTRGGTPADFERLSPFRSCSVMPRWSKPKEGRIPFQLPLDIRLDEHGEDEGLCQPR